MNKEGVRNKSNMLYVEYKKKHCKTLSLNPLKYLERYNIIEISFHFILFILNMQIIC